LLCSYLQKNAPLAVALSGGADSRALIIFCLRNQIEYAGFTVVGPHITDYEINAVASLVRDHGLNHSFFFYDYRHNSLVASNSKQRCFYCKSSLFAGPAMFFSGTHTLADGTSFSDTLSYRPGIRALKDLGISSPFSELGMTREEVSILARDMGLKESVLDSRSCILSRFRYGLYLDYDLVLKIREAESRLLENGLKDFRLRVINRDSYLLQVSLCRQGVFEKIRPGFDELMSGLGLKPYAVRFLPFEEISGHFDRDPND
jgi:pyridinium-3,5-biscarboxylic acid mononucleotide sulfurtransferase